MQQEYLDSTYELRRKRLDELFEDQPYLSVTMRASRLHERIVPEPIPPPRSEPVSILKLVAAGEGQRPVAIGGKNEVISVHDRTSHWAAPSSNPPDANCSQVLTQRPVAAEEPATPPEVMTIHEVAGYLRTSVTMIRTLIRDHKLPCVRIGRGYRFRRQAALDWLARMEVV